MKKILILFASLHQKISYKVFSLCVSFALVFSLLISVIKFQPIVVQTTNAASPSLAQQVYTWGDNSYGALGNGTTTNSDTPVSVSGMSGVVQVAAGNEYVVALKSDGTVWTWGYGGDGELGNGAKTNSDTPVEVEGVGGSGYLTDIIAIAASQESATSLALTASGTVYAWGYNYYGQRGVGYAADDLTTPVEVVGAGGSGNLTGITQIAESGANGLALRSDGTVWVWGKYADGELGNGTTCDSGSGCWTDTPSEVSISGVKAITAGANAGFALKDNGEVYAWGRDIDNTGSGLNYELDITSSTTCNAHTDICVPTPAEIFGISDIMDMNVGQQAQGYNEQFAVKSGGALYESGANESSPTSVSGFSSGVAKGIVGGTGNFYILKSNGTIYGWGSNNEGQLGNGNTTSISSSSSAVEVSGLSDVSAVSAGPDFAVALAN